MSRRPIVRAIATIALALALGITSEGASLEEDDNALSFPFEIEINGKSHGEVVARTTATLDIVELQGSDLRELVVDFVSLDFLPLIESLPDDFTSLETLRELGLEIHLDLERLVIALQIQERTKNADTGPRSIQLGYQRQINYDGHEPQARFSGYANLRFRSQRSQRDGLDGELEHSLGIDHVLNLSGYALEGESLWNEQDGFSLRDLRLVRDFPNKLLRLSVGDISTPINDLQRGFQLVGASLSKEFGIQPYRTFTPTSSASFRLEESATVNVKVNGRLARTLQLDAGDYSIEEFKLAAGPNTMELEIQTDSGLHDSLNVSEFGALHLLDSGVSTYSLSMGFPRASESTPDATRLTSVDWFERYIEKEPLLSGYYKKGLSNQFTGTIDFQGSADWNRLGVGVYTASERFGSLNLSLSHNRVSQSKGAISSRLTWNRDLFGYGISLSSLYSGIGYSQFQSDQQASERDLRSTHSLTISKLFREKLNASISYLQQTRHDGSRRQTTTARIGRRFGPVYASLSLRSNRDDRSDEHGGFLSLTWNPARKWRARSLARYSNVETGNSLSTSLDYSNRRANSYLNARINAEKSESGFDYDGSITFENERFSAAFAHTEVYDTIDGFANQGRSSSLTIRSAVAFADGSIGFTRNIRDSFAIVDKHAAWGDETLGINPSVNGFEHYNKSRLFSPVLPNLRAYREDVATIQTVDSDLFLERNDYYFFPGYRRGVRLELGDDAIYSLRSTLTYSDGEPVKYKAILFVREDGESFSTFTNAVGRFLMSGLTTGRYRIQAPNTDETAIVEIHEGETLSFVPSIALQ
ncbi:fimbria/pilus outer membrane usher protein [Pelagicoccus sp. SDUM812003]|uniref:fimbria/pilus outer membrane usher protein n=1 Tax=Pelagicoccus sp. SDUM812003 TaxID=3041267 RepID=UPI00280F7A44|nr:fimbria/pilus outer membrane usher protein [Pelagicoccus sp. SDUM812003]MDQ8202045.1 fimbria/pilus outer membrane usher protein [Pelagicoccus sp. SDUM812003]